MNEKEWRLASIFRTCWASDLNNYNEVLGVTENPDEALKFTKADADAICPLGFVVEWSPNTDGIPTALADPLAA